MPVDFSELPNLDAEHPELSEEERIFAAHMAARETALESLFGPTEPPGEIMSPADPNLSVNWPGGGIHQYPPREGRTGWHYVTHGLAQPFDPEEEAAAFSEDPDELSGFGLEYVMSSPEANEWAPDVLLSVVGYLLFNEDSRPLVPGARIPFGKALSGDGSITHAVALVSTEYEPELILPAGNCTLFHLVGVTDAEVQRAKDAGGFAGTFVLAGVLDHYGVGVLTDPNRACLTARDDFEEVWQRVLEEVQAQMAGDEDE